MSEAIAKLRRAMQNEDNVGEYCRMACRLNQLEKEQTTMDARYIAMLASLMPIAGVNNFDLERRSYPVAKRNPTPRPVERDWSQKRYEFSKSIKADPVARLTNWQLSQWQRACRDACERVDPEPFTKLERNKQR